MSQWVSISNPFQSLVDSFVNSMNFGLASNITTPVRSFVSHKGKMKTLKLDCNCIWITIDKKVKFSAKVNERKCIKKHPLTFLNVGLINDYAPF